MPENADAFRAVELVTGQREHVDVFCFDVDRDMTDRLHRIRMEVDAVCTCDCSDLCDRLDGSDLVVCIHDGYENRIRPDCLFHIRRRDHAVLIDRQIRHLKSLRLKPLGGMKNGVVLNGSGDDVFSFADVGKGNSLQCPVVRLGTALSDSVPPAVK